MSGFASGYAAFFDVDETVINLASMLDFLAFFDEGLSQKFAAKRGIARQRGVDRAELNRIYYNCFAGYCEEAVLAAGLRWYTDARKKMGEHFFIENTLLEMQAHQARGAKIVLVSGSFAPCLAALAVELGADAVLAVNLETRDGHYTGEILGVQTIGAGKAVVLGDYCREKGLDPKNCHGYGDHISDLPLLAAVGYPHVVRGCAELEEAASSKGWPVIYKTQIALATYSAVNL